MIVSIVFLNKGCDKLIEVVPDNYDAFVTYEQEQERLKRIHKRQEYEEEIDISNLPFYIENEGEDDE